MVKENLKEDQYIWLRIHGTNIATEYKCTCILFWMRPFRNIVFLCLNTIDEVVQIFPPTGFREISLS